MNKVVCCNCMELFKSMEDNSVDLIVTDMPYGINFKSNRQNYNSRTGVTYKIDREEYFKKLVNDNELFVDWLDEAYRVLKDNTAMYIFCHWSKWHSLYYNVELAKFRIKHMIVLNKSNWGMGDLKSFAPKHELIMMATKGKHKVTFPEKRISDVWSVPVKYSGVKRLHPNEKPISWVQPCIELSSKPGDLVFDPFAGSGTTGVACRALGRNYIMCDIDEKFCDIAKERLESEK